MGIQEPHPSGRRGLQVIDQHADRQLWRILHAQVNMVFFTIELKDAAVEFFASRFKCLSELPDHVAVEHFAPILRRENKVDD
ncbi:hypothetical protein SAMN05421693_1408 [Ectothiorhodospira magna]|uniref:Uncharacterized protein n=1 Tax=Ectothiorhodospira magna TaxID=867345 RepID=A0A1H9GLK7_9GAMM|nr:hypothetical protein SAMN05421693_1408 [Ectothiorhodospira magna]